MAVHLCFLILSGLTGTHSITTVSKVSVKIGDSITIPCLYESQYTNNVKYLCKGYFLTTCSYAVKSNLLNSEKFSISDDKSQRVFTVTINDIMDRDIDYWCGVEINGKSHVGEYFQLSATRGVPLLYVDHQEIRAVKGSDITVNCHHLYFGEIKWCKMGSSCVTGSAGSIDGATVTIDVTDLTVFTVTMSGLTTENSGWYQCVKGNLQMPVHVTVVSTEQDEHSSFLKDFSIHLSLAVAFVMVNLFIWFMFRRYKMTKESTITTTAEMEVRCNDVQYMTKTDEVSFH